MENEMNNKEENYENGFKLKLLLMDIMTLIALVLIGVISWKSLERDSILTEKVLALSQANGIDFQTKTNSLLGTKFIKPLK